MCSTVQEQITTCGQNAIVKIGERTNIRPQKQIKNEFATRCKNNYKLTPKVVAAQLTPLLGKTVLILRLRKLGHTILNAKK